MSTPIKISQLTELLAVTSDDYLVLNDSGSATTKRAAFSTVAQWLTGSGIWVSASFHANSASNATSASYAENSNYANVSILSLLANAATTATSAITASYALVLSGSLVSTSSATIDTTQYINAKINGVTYKLALVA